MVYIICIYHGIINVYTYKWYHQTWFADACCLFSLFASMTFPAMFDDHFANGDFPAMFDNTGGT